jgi:NADH-quinone oxidoreductase subunit G
MPKLTTACSTEVRDGMEVGLYVPEAEKARRGVIEFWLLNHPLDCPICDQGGECPLQDIAFDHGPGRSRLQHEKIHFDKRKVLGPTVILDEERCILCWRCTRFTQEVSESHQLMLDERGAHTTISTPPDRELDEPFSGNVVDLCPVGALTTRDFRFKSRIWEMGASSGVATGTSVGENIWIWSKKGRVERITARPNLKVNDYWISDANRFDFKFVNDPARLTLPLLRSGDRLLETSWDRGIRALADGLGAAAARGPGRVGALFSRHLSNEEYWAFQKLVRGQLGSNHLSAGRDEVLTGARASLYQRGKILDSAVKLEGAEVVVAVGHDVEKTHGVHSLRLRKAVRERGVKLLLACENESRLESAAAATERVHPNQVAAWLQQLAAAVTAKSNDGFAGTLRNAQRVVFLINAGDHNARVAEIWDEIESAAPGSAWKPMFLDRGGNVVGSMLLGISPHYYPGLGRIHADAAQSWKGRWGGKVNGEPGLPWTRMLEAGGAGKLQALLLVNSGRPAGWGFTAEERAQIARVPFVAAFDLVSDEVRELASAVIPTPSFAEIDGTYTNQDGLVQMGNRNIVPKTVPVLETLHRLTGVLGGKPRARTAADVFREIVRDVPHFATMTHARILDEGGVAVGSGDAVLARA